MGQETTKSDQEKEAIIAEYLTGTDSYRQLGVKHGIDFRRLHSWVTKFRGSTLKETKSKSGKPATLKESPPLPTDVKQLQEELRKSKLYNELLNTMIDLAEDQLKIDIRKKSGIKQ